MNKLPTKDQIDIGSKVSIETKVDQGTDKLTGGIVSEILTSSNFHPHGIKVRLKDGQVGRVKRLEKPIVSNISFKNLDTLSIPTTEDQHNEFKEFFQYDKKISKYCQSYKKIESLPLEQKKTVEGLIKTAREEVVQAVCEFGNTSGGFIFLGIKDDGEIVGLERDKIFASFKNYKDRFANKIEETLKNLISDKVLTNNIQMQFRKVDKKTICVIQVLQYKRPLFYVSKSGKSIFRIRGIGPRGQTLEGEEQSRYIKDHFPNW